MGTSFYDTILAMTTKALKQTLRQRSYHLLFNNQTRSGRKMEAFWVIIALLSVLLLFLEPGGTALYTPNSRALYLLFWAEVFFTGIFTLEYLLRLWATPGKERYACSFFGIVDLLTVLPMYIIWLFPHMAVEYVALLRILRILRVLRALKLLRYMSEMGMVWRSLKLARHKLTMFFGFVGVVLCVFGGLMYAVEGGSGGFTSLAASMYWAVVTLTTVGYGDIVPHTPLGRMLASVLILVGYSIIAVPTGILTAYMSQEMQRYREKRRCEQCQRGGHETEAAYCKYCGAPLPPLPGKSTM
ncbi:voltage-gated potassium channel [Serratia fonticola]|jgi:voltage-gated potassium channel|uniref:Voltage-gated potassium channel n=1 Tax=Serratia fonticola TaxID=47917 RepID=A0A542D1E2_SERFO|nr:ion transporter [Serratia fonticola]TQI81136.1 voltage-gated potassium channel [Serratia fonticola]TQI96840.1 voltage-gated potassium channel [Serratia fonticola]TVZ71335.1 voltage-gated potassium channel [Serratia fonticola]